MIVALEGVDQSGKSTQSYMLVKALDGRGFKARRFSFPDYDTPTGLKIRASLARPDADPHLVHSLMAQNRQERLADIRNAQGGNAILVMDRYTDSNVIYGTVNGLDRERLARLDDAMPKADITVLLDISEDESFLRKKDRDSFESNRPFIKKVVEAYRRAAKRHGWIIVDGERDPDTVHRDMLGRVLCAMGTE